MFRLHSLIVSLHHSVCLQDFYFVFSRLILMTFVFLKLSRLSQYVRTHYGNAKYYRLAKCFFLFLDFISFILVIRSVTSFFLSNVISSIYIFSFLVFISCVKPLIFCDHIYVRVFLYVIVRYPW